MQLSEESAIAGTGGGYIKCFIELFTIP